LPNNAMITKIASDGSRLLVLSLQPTKGNALASYSLHLLLPNPTGTLQDINASTINSTLMQDGNTPTLITAWGPDVYVVLTSTNTAAQNRAVIVDYTMSTSNKLNPGATTSISTSTGILSVAAFPNHQLFILNSDGSVQSLMNGSQTAINVVVQHPIALPLPIGANEFTFNAVVPQVVPQSSVFLTLPRATSLAAGQNQTDKNQHLYIVDGLYHRILDLKIAVATASSTTPTPASTTGGTGGGVAGAGNSSGSLTMQLLQQYASPHLLAHVKSIVPDPKEAQLYLLTQNEQNPATLNLVSLDVSQNKACIL
jgi:hypothetical protein